jgi:hypothetical protein
MLTTPGDLIVTVLSAPMAEVRRLAHDCGTVVILTKKLTPSILLKRIYLYRRYLKGTIHHRNLIIGMKESTTRTIALPVSIEEKQLV